MALDQIQNPLLEKKKPKTETVFDAKKLKAPWSVKGHVPSARELKKLMRKETAAEAVGELYPSCAIFGITKGQFSLIELIAYILDQTGPADIFLSTWTASGADLTDAANLLSSGKIKTFRMLVDMSFQRRQPAFASKARELFGIDAIRVTRNHAKFCLIRNPKWNIVLKTSMNLNFNPRLEDFDIQDSPEMADFLQDILEEIFVRIKPRSLTDIPKDNSQRFKIL